MASSINFDRGDDKDTYRYMKNDHVDLVLVLDYLLLEFNNNKSPLRGLKNTNIIVTSINRHYELRNAPTYTYNQLLAYFKSKNKNVDINTIKSKFFNRDNGIINENEWIYKDVIIDLPNAATDRAFVKYSAHLKIPGKQYSSAIDISARNLGAHGSAVAEAIRKKFGTNSSGKEWIYVKDHTIKGNTYHIHIEDKISYNAYSNKLKDLVNNECGYTSVANMANNAKTASIPFNLSNNRSPYVSPQQMLTEKDCAILIEDDINDDTSKKKNRNIKQATDTRTTLPSVINNDGLMDVLRIGDIDFSVCPVSQISYSQSMQYVRFSTLRTKGDPKIASDSVPNNINISLIFPNISSINNQLKSLLAQFIVTPITIIQSRFIARVLKPLVVNHKNEMVTNEFVTVDDECMWMALTDINIRSIPEFPEAFELYLSLEVFEDRVFGDHMQYLVGIEDLQEKYKRKKLIHSNQYILPSEKTMMENAKAYEPGTINVTKNPNMSTLYKLCYGGVKDGLPDYKPTPNSNGIFSVIYNAFDFSRESIRQTKLKIQKNYDEQLYESLKIMNNLSQTEKQYFLSKGINIVDKNDIRVMAGNIGLITAKNIQLAVQESQITKTYMGLRYMAVDPILKLRELTINSDLYLNAAFEGLPELKKNKELQKNITEVFEKTLKSIGSLQAYSDGLPSVGKTAADGTALRDQLKNPTSAVNIGSTRGTIAALEIFANAKLYDGIDIDNKKQVKNRTDLISKTLSRLTILVLSPISSDTRKLTNIDSDGLPVFPNSFKQETLVDGVNSIITGVSFSMSNKIVPQQVIGWRQATFQHLGRSDWSVNMNIVCRGDDALKTVMYVMNRLGIISKQIQFTSPAKFVNLDTTLHIEKADPIFKTLGVNTLVLNTAEISSINNSPNCYQITLGLEQADVSIRHIEKIKQDKSKLTNQSVSNILSADVLPILKAFIIRKDHPNYGRFLDFEKIRAEINKKEYNFLWSVLGVDNGVYDYMDKYNFCKIFLSNATFKDITIEWNALVNSIFPTSYTVINKAINKLPNELKTQLAGLIRLIKNEINPEDIWKHGFIIEPDKATIVLEGYYESVGYWYTLYKNQKDKNFINNTPTPEMTSALSDIFSSAAIGTAGAALVTFACTPPGLIVIGIALGVAGLSYLVKRGNKLAENAIQKLRSELPSLFSVGFNYAINGRLIDLAKEFVADETSLNLFTENFLIDSTSKVTLQDRLRKLRNLIVSSFDGCYNDYSSEIANIAEKSGIDKSLLDPAFYLYSDDIITTDLINETKIDIQNSMSLLVTRANIRAMQLGTEIETKYKIDKNYKFDGSLLGPDNQSKLITGADLDWAVLVKRKLVDINMSAINEMSTKNLKQVVDTNNDTALTRLIYTEESREKYWTHMQKDAKTEVYIETAFARLLLINEALRFDSIASQLDLATVNLREKIASLKESKSTNDNDGVKLALLYDKLMVSREFGDAEVNDAAGKNITWYEAILNAGSIDNPYNYKGSIDSIFKDNNGVGIRQYFNEPRMQELLNTLDVLAKCKKASSNNATAEMMAQFNALEADPRMIEKRADTIQSVQDNLFKLSISDYTGNPIRIFPTYKIYFIEEDAPEWGIYNDFYNYSAVQDITVVKDRNSASDTCVIKLSNIAGNLTDSFAENMPEYGTTNFALTSMMLKPGTSILVKMGYSNSEVHLPVVFYGVIIEVQPGPIVEIICQGYGAELNEIIAPNEGYHHGVFGDVKALGDLATWSLQQATGLDHFGKLGADSFGVRDKIRLSGTSTSGLQGKSKIASFITGLPGLNLNDPRDDNVFLQYNMSNITEKKITGKLDLLVSWALDHLHMGTNLTFDWYMRDTSIWEVLTQIVYFQPDYIKAVLPYNDNVFPFLPKIRNTLYVGPKRGYYKYTDMYSIIAKDGNIEFTGLDDIQKHFYGIVYDMLIIESQGNTFADDNYSATLGDIDFSKEIKGGTDHVTPVRDALLLNSGLRSALEVLLNVQISDAKANYAAFDHKEKALRATIVNMALAYGRKYTNYTELHEKAGNIDIDELLSQLHIIPGESLLSSVKHIIQTDVGVNGFYYNIFGDNHQYRKVQQHHISTAYTNILNNNIIATSDGWANQIKLISPENPISATSKEDVAIPDRKDLITTVFNLDDDILNDQINTKEVYINNIDSNMWDDAIWAKKVLKGEAAWNTIAKGKFVNNDSYGNPIVNDITDEEKKTSTTFIKDNGEAVDIRNAWECLPSRWRVGVSILAEEVRDMYNGELTIIGDPTIKPYDIMHVFDHVNDMHGAIEVGRVIHSISPQNGYITRIKPDLIVNQKNKFNEEELNMCSRMISMSVSRSVLTLIPTGMGAALSAYAIQGPLVALASALNLAAVASAGLFIGLPLIFLSAGYVGYKAISSHHERIIGVMNNVVGRDSMEILPLTYRGLPYVAGVEGMKKDNYLRHMTNVVVNTNNKLNIFERAGYMTAGTEYEFFRNVANDSPVLSFIETNILGAGANSEGVPFLKSAGALYDGIFNPGK